MDRARICGAHAVYEALVSGQLIERVHIARGVHSNKVKEILNLARQRGVPIRNEERSVIDRMAPGDVHQGIIAVSGGTPYADFDVLFKDEKPIVVVLDGVEDPHNLGAVIRTAEAVRASGVVVPERHAAPLSATVVKASAGAAAHIPVVRVKNIVATIGKLKERGLWVVGVDPSGSKDWTGFEYTVPVALVLGGEHRGLRRLVKEHCDVMVRLPMLGKVASLNISVAAGIVLYEVVRQRGFFADRPVETPK